MNSLFIVLLLLASVLGSGLIGLALWQGQRRQERLKIFAAERGWTYQLQPSSGGSGRRTVIANPSEGWELVQYFQSSGSQGGSTRRWTQFTQPGLALPEGLALLGPEIPQKTAAMAESLLAGSGGGMIGRMLLDRMTGGLGDEAAALRSVPAPGAGTLFATPGQEETLSPVRDLPELAQARQGKNEAMQPVVSISPEGLRIRQTGLLKSRNEVQSFVDLGRALSARLSE